MKRIISTLGIASLIMTTSYSKNEMTEKVNENSDFISSLEFKNGYPTDETSQKLYDEMDFKRATQAYIWGFPLVSSAAIRKGMTEYNDTITSSYILLQKLEFQ